LALASSQPAHHAAVNQSAGNQQIALALISRLEALHQAVVHDLHGNPEASHQLITRWSVDADRLMHGRNMLGNVDLG